MKVASEVMTPGTFVIVTLAFGIPTAIVIVGLLRQASRRRKERAPLNLYLAKGLRLRHPVSWLVLSVMFAAGYTFFTFGLNLSPWGLAVALEVLIVPLGLTGWHLWRTSGRLGPLGRDDGLCLALAAGFIVATIVARVA
jgi:hypothetical protein